MKQPEFLKKIHIGEIIRAEMKQHHLTDIMLANKIGLSKWGVSKMLKHKSLKVNKIIELSYAIGVNLLHSYLKGMPVLKNTETSDDEIIIKIINEQVVIIPSKKIRTSEFLQSVHIGKILKKEVKYQKITEEALSKVLCCTQSTVSRIFTHPDIDIERLILLSYKLNCDFIRNIYLPFMAVDENEMITNDIISDGCSIKINPKAVSIITEKQPVVYLNAAAPNGKNAD